MSGHLYTPAYATRFGNLTAKSVLVRLCDQASDDAGVLWTSVATIARDTEISRRTVLRMMEVFVTMGLVELKWVLVTDRHGSRKRREIHVDLAMLGKDLTEAFAAAYIEAQGKSATSKPQLVDEGDDGLFDESVAATSAPSVAETRKGVVATRKSVAETQKGVAETFPPHPHIGGTFIEPSLNPQEPCARVSPEFDAEQREHLDRVRAKHGDVGMWETFYREQNARAAKAATASDAEAVKDEELRSEYGDTVKAAMGRMRKRCGFAWTRGDLLEPVLRQVFADQSELGKPVWRTASQMENAWLLQRRQGPLLRARYGPVTFFRDGHWLDPQGWHWNTEQLARQAQAGAGSVQ